MSVIFKRTAMGLSSIHLFHKTNIVVFVEGGKTQFTKAEVYSGSSHDETEDIIFWSKIFNKFLYGKKLKYKSVGSKSTLKAIASDVIDNQISTVLIALDKEFDEILGKQLFHSNIYYTYGYSWENDVWDASVVEGVIENLSAVTIKHSRIKDNFDKFLRDLKIAVYADSYLFKQDDSFFSRKKGRLFCVDCESQNLPSIKRNEIDKRLNEKNLKKTTLYSFGSKYKINTKKFCYGHLLADYCFHVILKYLQNTHSLKNISKNIVSRAAISRFFNEQFIINGTVYEYYKKQFEINSALRMKKS